MNATRARKLAGGRGGGSGLLGVLWRVLRPRRASERVWVRPLEWPCCICGDWRPDARISVYTHTVAFLGLLVRENVRYCNDRPGCIAGAPLVRFLKEDT